MLRLILGILSIVLAVIFVLQALEVTIVSGALVISQTGAWFLTIVFAAIAWVLLGGRLKR